LTGSGMRSISASPEIMIIVVIVPASRRSPAHGCV
jgi:hypothetical protein